MDTTLVIMAAGMGSRFGGGIKQLEPVGPNGEIIMDYSIHDALEAGFTKVAFIIRKDLEKDFREVIGNRMDKICRTVYAFQEKDNLPGGFTCPADRTKPWGTGQAVLSCKGLVNEPFVVINADDYYGKEAFVKLHDYLVNAKPGKPYDCCMAGFILKNTLSDNGGVTRGVCSINENNRLVTVKETKNIVRTADGAAIQQDDDTMIPVDGNAHVSMNMWGLMPDFFETLESGFEAFLANLPEGDTKSEYLLPVLMDQLVQAGEAEVTLLETRDKWFGVTYKEDKPLVVESFRQLIADGVYAAKLYQE
jgi:hypothetical protein